MGGGQGPPDGRDGEWGSFPSVLPASPFCAVHGIHRGCSGDLTRGCPTGCPDTDPALRSPQPRGPSCCALRGRISAPGHVPV